MSPEIVPTRSIVPPPFVLTRDRQTPPSARRRPERDTSPERDAGRVVLVVEDDADARDALVELLESDGHRVVGVENGRRALEILKSGREVALVLLDLTMPVMDGWDFCAELKRDGTITEPPIAILTAAANYRRLPERRHDAGLFVKPLDFAKLMEVVRRFDA